MIITETYQTNQSDSILEKIWDSSSNTSHYYLRTPDTYQEITITQFEKFIGRKKKPITKEYRFIKDGADVLFIDDNGIYSLFIDGVHIIDPSIVEAIKRYTQVYFDGEQLQLFE